MLWSLLIVLGWAILVICIYFCFHFAVENQEGEYLGRDEFSFANRRAMENGNEAGAEKADGKPKAMPPTSVMTRLILIMVWRKLIRNPNTYSSLIGLTWSLICFRCPTLTHRKT